MKKQRKILLMDCPDCKGLVAQVTNICFKHQLNIIKNNEFVDESDDRFFMRTELEGYFNEPILLEELSSALPAQAHLRLVDAQKKRVVILATKEAHCLGDILMKNYYGALDVDIAAVISNHDDLSGLVEKFSIPYYFMSHQGIDREEHDNKILGAIAEHTPDYIVLAKYMRILTPNFVAQYPNRIINIHHSFLPAFIGAKPYHQAYERGVKVIGATAHFVNESLDDGPIITQDVIHVDHSLTAEAMAQAGRDVEAAVLTKALQRVLDEKVFVYGNRTVVFD